MQVHSLKPFRDFHSRLFVYHFLFQCNELNFDGILIMVTKEKYKRCVSNNFSRVLRTCDGEVRGLQIFFVVSKIRIYDVFQRRH